MNDPLTKSADLRIKVGDTLIGIDSNILILGYDSITDKYVFDIVNASGDLVEYNRSVEGDLLRTIFSKLG